MAGHDLHAPRPALEPEDSALLTLARVNGFLALEQVEEEIARRLLLAIRETQPGSGGLTVSVGRDSQLQQDLDMEEAEELARAQQPSPTTWQDINPAGRNLAAQLPTLPS